MGKIFSPKAAPIPQQKEVVKEPEIIDTSETAETPLRPAPESVMDLIKLSRQKGMAVPFLVSLPEPVTGRRWVNQFRG